MAGERVQFMGSVISLFIHCVSAIPSCTPCDICLPIPALHATPLRGHGQSYPAPFSACQRLIRTLRCRHEAPINWLLLARLSSRPTTLLPVLP